MQKLNRNCISHYILFYIVFLQVFCFLQVFLKLKDNVSLNKNLETEKKEKKCLAIIRDH